MSSDLGISSIGQIAMNVNNLDRAVTFYRDTLGLKHLFTVPPNMAFFDCGGIRLMLGLAGEADTHPSSVIYFNVPDIQQAHQALIERGVEIVEEPEFVANMGSYDLWIGFFRDSENNVLAFMSNVPH
jgi:predicted enzyme related to lactoylglutathione lyase